MTLLANGSANEFQSFKHDVLTGYKNKTALFQSLLRFKVGNLFVKFADFSLKLFAFF